jgi:hypothetical protein
MACLHCKRGQLSQYCLLCRTFGFGHAIELRLLAVSNQTGAPHLALISGSGVMIILLRVRAKQIIEMRRDDVLELTDLSLSDA